MAEPTAIGGFPLQDVERAWKLLTEWVEAFLTAWDSAREPPALSDFLPAEAGPLRKLVLVELIKVDLEYRWLERGCPRRIEEYLVEFPDLADAGIPCDLLYEEFHIRRQAGDAVEPREYLNRFPDQAPELNRLLELKSHAVSTALARRSLPQSQDLEPGQRLDDFDLLARLGRGAFASVFLARQRSMQRLVALKVSADHGSEPQTLAQIDHDHVVRVYDQRTLPDRRLRLLYMQYVPGGTLQTAIAWMRSAPPDQRSGRTLLEVVDRSLDERGESPPVGSSFRERIAAATWPQLVCWIGARLADALDYAHRCGVLHRDIKPANVLLTAEGAPKLADFNVSFSSKLEGAAPAAYFGGSVAYMSPEQLEAFNPAHRRRPDSLDGRSDVYSLGILLWELLTGSRPFPEESMDDGWTTALERMVARRRSGVDASAIAPLPRDCPPGLKDVLLKCLAVDPDQRFATAGELSRQLQLCLSPKARSLLAPPMKMWSRTVRRFPLAALMLAAVIPNALAAVFNFWYNHAEIALSLPEESLAAFWMLVALVNGTAFPVGIALCILIAWPVVRAFERLTDPTGRSAAPATAPGADAEALCWLRERCLCLGHYTAGVCLVLWVIAGVAYPTGIYALSGSIGPAAVVHFLASMALCGLIAAAYPFFGVTFLSLRTFYPALIQSGPVGSDDLAGLGRLSRWTWLYLLLATSVPLLAMTLLVLIQSHNQLALIVLGAAGLGGVGLAYWLARMIQRDLAALAHVVRPSGDLLPGDDTTLW